MEYVEYKEDTRTKLLESLKEFDLDLDEFKRVFAFLLIFQEDAPGLPHPAYILEKYIRYIKDPAVKDEYLFGLHPLLMRRFEAYCEKYDLGVNNETEGEIK